MSSAKRFRVIVAGAGVAGLTASHCLQKAGIDHVVLERRPTIDPAEGASIAIYPHGAYILNQLGCLSALKAVCKPCQNYWSRRPDGTVVFCNPFFNYIKNNHSGQDILLLERRVFLRILHDCLPNKDYIKTGVGLEAITENQDGVEVLLSDGTIEKGDMVLGCDGVYSRVRSIMWDMACTPVEEKRAMQTRYKCLVGVGPSMAGLDERGMSSVHNDKFSFLLLTQPGRTFWFVFVKLEQPFTWPHRVNFTDDQAEQLASDMAEYLVSDSVTFGSVWERRERAMLIPIEEGVLKHFFWGRVVVAGDAAHKVTPNIALGGNTAMEGVVVLCNHLQRALAKHVDSLGAPFKPITRAALMDCFEAYKNQHRRRVLAIMTLSRVITGAQAWETPIAKFLALRVLPMLPDRTLAAILGLIIGSAPKVEFGGENADNKIKPGHASTGVSWISDPRVGCFVLLPLASLALFIAVTGRSWNST